MTPGQAGADVVIEAAGFLPAFPEGLELVKEDGVYVEVGHYVDVGTIEVNPHRHFLRPNLRLEGVRGSNFHHFVRAAAVMESGGIDFAAVISHILPLERVWEGFKALDSDYMLDGKTAFKIALRGRLEPPESLFAPPSGTRPRYCAAVSTARSRCGRWQRGWSELPGREPLR